MTQSIGFQQMKLVLNAAHRFLILGWDGQLTTDKQGHEGPCQLPRTQSWSWGELGTPILFLILLTLNLLSPFRASSRKNPSECESARSHGAFRRGGRAPFCSAHFPLPLSQPSPSMQGVSSNPPSAHALQGLPHLLPQLGYISRQFHIYSIS